LSDRNSSKDDEDTCDNEHDDDITSKTNTSKDNNGDFSSDNSSSDNDVKPKAKNKKSNGITFARVKKSSQHNKINVCDDMFNNLFSGDLKQEVAENVKKMTNSNSVPIYITGPFRNGKTCKSYWVVVYGDCDTAWMVQLVFIRGCLAQLLSCHQQSNINSKHCHTYEDINICKEEFGLESVWKCTPSTNKLINRLFLFTPVTQRTKISENKA
jgi:hypothetical protein